MSSQYKPEQVLHNEEQQEFYIEMAGEKWVDNLFRYFTYFKSTMQKKPFIYCNRAYKVMVLYSVESQI